MRILYVESNKERRESFAAQFAAQCPDAELTLADRYRSAHDLLNQNAFDAVIVDYGCIGYNEDSSIDTRMGGIDIFQDIAVYRNPRPQVLFYGNVSAGFVNSYLETRDIGAAPAGVFERGQEAQLFEALSRLDTSIRPVSAPGREKGPHPEERDPR